MECLNLFERCISGSSPASPALHKKTLYEAMAGLCRESDRYLDIDYGHPNIPHDQWWYSNPGEEFLVAKPAATPELAELVKSVIAKDEFRLEEWLQQPMGGNALVANRELWRACITDDLPWFYELPDMIREVEETSGRKVDLHKVWTWAEKETRPVRFKRVCLWGRPTAGVSGCPAKSWPRPTMSKCPRIGMACQKAQRIRKRTGTKKTTSATAKGMAGQKRKEMVTMEKMNRDRRVKRIKEKAPEENTKRVKKGQCINFLPQQKNISMVLTSQDPISIHPHL
jgi:hypothetical protein